MAAMLKPLLHSVDRDIFRSIAIHMFCICHLVLLHELLHGSREGHHITHFYSPFVIRPSLLRSWGSNYAGRVSTYQIRSCKQNKLVNRVYLNGFPTAHAAPGQRLRQARCLCSPKCHLPSTLCTLLRGNYRTQRNEFLLFCASTLPALCTQPFPSPSFSGNSRSVRTSAMVYMISLLSS